MRYKKEEMDVREDIDAITNIVVNDCLIILLIRFLIWFQAYSTTYHSFSILLSSDIPQTREIKLMLSLLWFKMLILICKRIYMIYCVNTLFMKMDCHFNKFGKFLYYVMKVFHMLKPKVNQNNLNCFINFMRSSK